MKNKNDLFKIACAVLLLWVGVAGKSWAQETKKSYWNLRTQLVPLRLPPPPPGYKPEYLTGNRMLLSLSPTTIYPSCGWMMTAI